MQYYQVSWTAPCYAIIVWGEVALFLISSCYLLRISGKSFSGAIGFIFAQSVLSAFY